MLSVQQLRVSCSQPRCHTNAKLPPQLLTHHKLWKAQQLLQSLAARQPISNRIGCQATVARTIRTTTNAQRCSTLTRSQFVPKRVITVSISELKASVLLPRIEATVKWLRV